MLALFRQNQSHASFISTKSKPCKLYFDKIQAMLALFRQRVQSPSFSKVSRVNNAVSGPVGRLVGQKYTCCLLITVGRLGDVLVMSVVVRFHHVSLRVVFTEHQVPFLAVDVAVGGDGTSDLKEMGGGVNIKT